MYIGTWIKNVAHVYCTLNVTAFNQFQVPFCLSIKMPLSFPTSEFHICVKTFKNLLVCVSAKIISWP